MTKIKLCGLSSRDDILSVNALLPDYIGFVFAEKSRRYVLPGQASELKRLLDEKIRAVGVFVNAEMSFIMDLAGQGIIDMAQLHGNEDEEYIQRLKTESGIPVIKAFGIAGQADAAEAVSSSADLILLDHKNSGSGTSFDWNVIKDIKRPYLLAGGLDSEKAVKAVKELHPYGVDVSSGIETEGKKDPLKMADFISAVRRMDREEK